MNFNSGQTSLSSQSPPSSDAAVAAPPGVGPSSPAAAASSSNAPAPAPSPSPLFSSSPSSALASAAGGGAVDPPRSVSSSSVFDSPGPSSAASAGASASAAHEHPDLPPELLQRIESSDPALRKLEIQYKSNFKETGCRILARALSLNTCITSLNLMGTTITPAGAALLCPALAHLTAMTCLNLWNTDIQSSGASHLCSALTHLTAMTQLDLSDNQLTADDGARICGAAAAAGMTRLEVLDLNGNPSYESPFSASSVVGCGVWRQLNLPQPPDDFIETADGCRSDGCPDVLGLVQYLTSSDRAAFAAAYHPLLPPELLRCIESNDPALTELTLQSVIWRTTEVQEFGIMCDRNTLNEAGSRILARALSLNTCITSLNLSRTIINPSGPALLCPSLTHLTAMTVLDLSYTDLSSSGASHLLSTFAHLTAMTQLDLSYNQLTADDGARICGAAAAAGMTRLKRLFLGGNPYTLTPPRANRFSASSVVGCGAWRQLNLPQPPDEIVRECGYSGYIGDCAALVSYLLSEDKVASHAIRIFVVGDSTVTPPPPFFCFIRVSSPPLPPFPVVWLPFLRLCCWCASLCDA
jgi:Leucine-rich repeat (LRR) protein